MGPSYGRFWAQIRITHNPHQTYSPHRASCSTDMITTWVPNVLNILCQSLWRDMSQLTIDRVSLPVAKRDSQIKSCTLLAFGKLLKLLVISRAAQANSSMSC